MVRDIDLLVYRYFLHVVFYCDAPSTDMYLLSITATKQNNQKYLFGFVTSPISTYTRKKLAYAVSSAAISTAAHVLRQTCT